MRQSLILLFCIPVLLAPPAAEPASGYGTNITFAGRSWRIKIASARTGPGPNYFSDSTDNVWVDSAGRLHLRIAKTRGKWYCAEVVLNDTLGYGTYRFYLDSAVDALDPNVVLGLFTWSDDPAYHNREMDIEFSRWGNQFNQNAQYVVQPQVPFRFMEPPGVPQSTHTFNWQSNKVTFESWQSQSALPGTVIAQSQVTSGIPQTGTENVRMNLWLYQGHPPTNGSPAEVVVKGFEFAP